MLKCFSKIAPVIFLSLLFIACGGGGGPASTDTDTDNGTGVVNDNEKAPILIASPYKYTPTTIHNGWGGRRIKISGDSLFIYSDRLEQMAFDSDIITTSFENTPYSENFHDRLYATDTPVINDLYDYINPDFQVYGDKIFTLNHSFGNPSYGLGINTFNKYDYSASVVGVAPKYGGYGTIISVIEHQNFLYWIAPAVTGDGMQLFKTPTHHLKTGDAPNTSTPNESILPDYRFSFASLYSLEDSILIYDKLEGCFYSFNPGSSQLDTIRCDSQSLVGLEVVVENNRIFAKKWINKSSREVYEISKINGQSSLSFISDSQVIAADNNALYYLAYDNEQWFVYKYILSANQSELSFNLSQYLSDSLSTYPGSNYYFLMPFIDSSNSELIILERQNQPEARILKHRFDATSGAFKASKDISTLIRDFHPDDLDYIDSQYIYLRYSTGETSVGDPIIFDLVEETQIQPHSLYWAVGSDGSLSAMYMDIENKILYGAKGTDLYRIELDHFPAPMDLVNYEPHDGTNKGYNSIEITDQNVYWIEYELVENTAYNVITSRVRRQNRSTSLVSTVYEVAGFIRDIKAHQDGLYFLQLEENGEDYVHRFMHINLNDHTSEELVEIQTGLQKMEHANSNSDAMVFHGGKVYFPLYGDFHFVDQIYSLDLSSKELVEMTNNLGKFIHDFDTDGEYLYFINKPTNTISDLYGMTFDGTGIFKVDTVELCTSYEYRQEDDSIYISCTGEIMKLARDE